MPNNEAANCENDRAIIKMFNIPCDFFFVSNCKRMCPLRKIPSTKIIVKYMPIIFSFRHDARG